MKSITPIRALVFDILRQVTKMVEQDCTDEQLASAIQLVIPNIELDGGINPTTARICIEAGANVLVAGNSVFTADDPKTVINAIRTAAD